MVNYFLFLNRFCVLIFFTWVGRVLLYFVEFFDSWVCPS